MGQPLAYFITFTTYGTWLQGRDPGSVIRGRNQYGTPVMPPDPAREENQRGAMRQKPYRLDEGARCVVLQTILEVAEHRMWQLWAVHVRTNHVHIVVTAPHKPEKVMIDFKAWASRRLREALKEDHDRDRWSQHGSTKYLWTHQALMETITYVVEGQGDPLAVYKHPPEPDA